MGVSEHLHLADLEPELRYIIYFLVVVHASALVRSDNSTPRPCPFFIQLQ